MKNLFILSVLLTCTLFSFGQTDGTAMIKSVYGLNQYNEMSSNNPGQIVLLEKYVLFGFHVEPTTDKYNTFTELAEIPLRSKLNETITVQAFLLDYNSGNFNPLAYSFFLCV